jgi:AraC family transcriptional regulator of adaptative response/methylated-DNA-[protein]-cysteine methyltransferase
MKIILSDKEVKMAASLDANNSTEDRYWKALVDRDAGFDGQFFYAVKSTGVYCRPGCKSRQPRRENVLFFETAQAAENAGYRPCKRCSPAGKHPDHERSAAIIEACAIIDQADQPPGLQDLAQAVGLSPYYFQRLFKRIVGISPKDYFEEKRAGRMRANLQNGQPISEAIYDSGFGSNSRLYSQAGDILGMAPSVYRKGGDGLRLRFSVVTTHLGWVLVAASERGICAIDFGESPAALEETLARRFPAATITKDDVDFASWVRKVTAFLESPRTGLDLPLDIQGTAFQRRVWQALKSIPFGSTTSYAEIAVKIGKPKAVRAVAQACAANKIAVAIPCHRVVRSNGDLGGYRWGRERKRKILAMEQDKPENSHSTD